MANSTEDQIVEFQEAFALFDNKNDGKISVSLLGNVLRALGQNPTEAEVKKCSNQFKPDERITFEVFLPILQAISKNRCNDQAEDFIEGLRHFDKDGSGYILAAELRNLLTTLGEKLTDDEVEQLLNGQEDSQGNIQYEDFVRMVMGGNAAEMAVEKILSDPADFIEDLTQKTYRRLSSTLIQNCGGDTVRQITTLRAKHSFPDVENKTWGIDGEIRKIINIWELFSLKMQAYKTSVLLVSGSKKSDVIKQND